MGIKDLFNKGYSLKFLKNKTRQDLREDLESQRYLDSYSTRRQRFFPDTDFTTASNFARFGLAEEYYDTAIKRIYQTYPYDGSQAEKIEWENESTYLDLFIFENEYPRTNGHIIINSDGTTYTSNKSNSFYSSSVPQYIYFAGGPHADPDGNYKSDFSAGPSKKGISKANIYHTASQRTSNLEFDLEKGATIEFWMKKDGYAFSNASSADASEVLFHLAKSGSYGDTHNQEIFIYKGTGAVAGANVGVSISSGSTQQTFINNIGSATAMSDSAWHHYAFTFKKIGANTVTNLYVDGAHQSTDTRAATFDSFDGPLVASLGAFAHHNTYFGTSLGGGNIVSASFDEFRYWKTDRNAQQIGRFYRDQVGGGTNTDNIKYDDISNKIDLGVYYKFNEGISGDSSTDSTILDYSGRITNGTFVNYSSDCRNTGSAIVLANAATKEFKDPILYSWHPDVSTFATTKKKHGKMHDFNNQASLYKSVPGWILEEDEKESNHLKILMQILASYFDDLYLQIEKLSKLKDINYPDDNNYEKPLPFADRLLESKGYDAPELFAHASALAQYLERDEKRLFEKKLYEVKNIIYQNIYNNLSYIQKSKGTYKSLRNFLRCFGVDEELIKLNIYANNDVYELKDNFTNTALRKKFIDFDDLETKYAVGASYSEAYSATAYQFKDASVDNSISYIPAISANQVTGAALTIEAEVILPKRSLSGDHNIQMFPTLTSSIFGLHAVAESDSNMTFATDDTINFNIVLGKSSTDRRSGHFSLTTSGSSNILTDIGSSHYIGLYDNQKWNIAFRLKPAGHPAPGTTLHASDNYIYELYGNNYLTDTMQNEFFVSGTISRANAAKFFTQPKRIFIGASRNNFTGSITKYSDVKISSVRAWYSYLDNETMRAHGRDSNTYGALHPLKNSNSTDRTYFLGTKIPQIKTLILNWNMDNLTGSNDSGRFAISDFSSGSNDESSYGFLTPIIEKNYTGRGDFFTSATAQQDQAIDVEFVQTARQKLPEVVNSDDMVKVLNKQDDVVFTRETTYVQHLLSIEKSMYQAISEEMIRFFASVSDFNNLIGEPVNRYRPNYKKLEKLRELFFSRVEADVDLETFIEYYKWIDDAVTVMIGQLIPASSNTVELLRNMVESHILERNKYWTKFPTLQAEPPDPVYSFKGIEELKYSWKFGHAPVNASQNSNQDQSCLWWKQRAERSGVLSSGVTAVDADKDKILKITVTEISGTEPTLKTVSGTKYGGNYYAARSLSRPYEITSDVSLELKAGSNPKHANRHDIYKNIIKWGSDDDFIFIDADNETPKPDCSDELIPDENNKKLFRVKAITMKATETVASDALATGYNDQRYDDGPSTLMLPFSLYSSSIDTGYRQVYSGGSMPKIEFANLHDDKYGFDAEIPMQGPFTEKYVGGLQHRHVDINRYDPTVNSAATNKMDSPLTRPEGWHLQEFTGSNTTIYIINEEFSGATTTGNTDISILGLPLESEAGDPSDHESWNNGVSADNSWTFLKGPTPTMGTGPSQAADGASGGYAYCEVIPSKVGQTFSLVTPLLDLSEIDTGSVVVLYFKYHMYGLHIGKLKVQASRDRNFETDDVEDLEVDWGDFNDTVISGQQQTSDTEGWRSAFAASNLPPVPSSLNSWLGKRFYIRFLYTAGITHLGDCAIDYVRIYKSNAGTFSNSFKLFNPTYDNHNRPSAIYTRQEYAKRPVNIRNIHMTGNSPTVAGNYLNRHEYVSTTSPEANDPFFVKNVDKIASTTAELLMIHKVTDILSSTGSVRNALSFKNYRLPDRSYITGTFNDTTGKWTVGAAKNRTRIMTRFSSPGGFESTSRGFLDPAHETYSVYNAMTYRNISSRIIYNTQLQAHQGKFGVSTHGIGPDSQAISARVYGSEASGTINSLNYDVTGDASKHKYHRNNIERIRYVGDQANISSAIISTASFYDNAFISHMIPRTDNQTSWITASLI